MSEIITELYYMVDAWAGQQYERSEEARGLEEKRFALMEEIARRVGEGGMEMVEELSNLWLKLEDIHNEALFRASVRMVMELAQKPVVPWGAGGGPSPPVSVQTPAAAQIRGIGVERTTRRAGIHPAIVGALP